MFKQIAYPHSYFVAVFAVLTACSPPKNGEGCGGEPSCLQKEIEKRKAQAAADMLPLDVSASIQASSPSTCFPKTPGIAWQVASLPWRIDITSDQIARNAIGIAMGRQAHESRCTMIIKINNIKKIQDYIEESQKLELQRPAQFFLQFNIQSFLQNIGQEETRYQDILALAFDGQPDMPIPQNALLPLGLDRIGGTFENFKINLVGIYSTEDGGNEGANLTRAQSSGLLLNTFVSITDIQLTRIVPVSE